MSKLPGEIALTFHGAGKAQINITKFKVEISFDIWILAFDILS
jgi:hypothetical protein